MIKNIISFIPNLITLFNLLSGCIAIIFAFSPREYFGQLQGWEWSALAIGLAALFDFMDGAAARLLNAKSSIGKELDSLSDLVSFGVAPALLMMNVLLLYGPEAGIWAYAPLFIPLMGALRLAKFNIDDSQSTVFKGLPIPANAIFWIGVTSIVMPGADGHPLIGIPVNLLVLAIFVIGILMVSNLRMFSLKFRNFKITENWLQYTIIAATIAALAAWGLPGLAAVILLYIVLSIGKAIIRIER